MTVVAVRCHRRVSLFLSLLLPFRSRGEFPYDAKTRHTLCPAGWNDRSHAHTTKRSHTDTRAHGLWHTLAYTDKQTSLTGTPWPTDDCSPPLLGAATAARPGGLRRRRARGVCGGRAMGGRARKDGRARFRAPAMTAAAAVSAAAATAGGALCCRRRGGRVHRRRRRLRRRRRHAVRWWVRGKPARSTD